MTFASTLSILLICGGGAGLAAAPAAESSLALTRDALSQWTQTRQLISQTRVSWESDRETLRQTKALYERELQGIREQFSRVSTNHTVADREREQVEAEFKQQASAMEAAKTLAAELEAGIRKTLPLLPATLLVTLKPFVDRMPSDASNSKANVTERLQSVVAVLNEIDKFNNAVTVVPEKRSNAKGESVSVDTLYLGLGSAWFVDASGEFAGTGVPSASGWVWKENSAIAPSVRDAVAIYRSQKPAAFVALPATIQ